MSEGNNEFIYGVVEGFYGRPWTTAQRKHLFNRMKNLGLNTYMYAPKDDFKHRAYWRELYSVEEGEQLSALIACSKENDVTFYYALSPGLDITYSNAKEINFLKRKLEQVAQFGCEAFALLFDDIEPEISEVDKEIFQSFGHAQVSVTNEVYQSLGCPKFLFCPTEYCASRAAPCVQNSDYLLTIGSKLHPNVDIMWTGNKVISKVISVQSIQELSGVLKRNPVIWDNIHANDYDQKRLFLGPYSGRSTELNTQLRGVLTNPNCEYCPNFIAMHTLAQWSKCDNDIDDGKISDSCSVSSDIKLEAENDCESLDQITSRIDSNSYHPRNALRLALKDWLDELNDPSGMHDVDKPSALISTPIAALIPTLTSPPPSLPVSAAVFQLTGELPVSICGTSNGDVGEREVCMNGKKLLIDNDSTFQPITKELVNSLVTPPIIINPLEPMDASPSLSPKNSEQMIDEPILPSRGDEKDQDDIEPETLDSAEILAKEMNTACSTEDMQTELSLSETIDDDQRTPLTYEDLNLLVDLFYLPFEHGSRGVAVLNQFQWLKANANLITGNLGKKLCTNSKSPEYDHNASEWLEKAKQFSTMSSNVERLFQRISNCRHRSFAYDLFPYIWDMRETISLLNLYIKYLALGKTLLSNNSALPVAFNWFSKGYREAFSSGDQEPWIFRGGLIGELQRLLPLEGAQDLFAYKSPETPTSHAYTIREYEPADESYIYDIYTHNFVVNIANECFKPYPNLPGDKSVGGFLTLSPEYCFVIELDKTVCGYVLAALDGRKFESMLQISWYPEICEKYPHPNEKINNNEPLNEADEMIISMHESMQVSPFLPETVSKVHQSLIHINTLTNVDINIVKRLLAHIVIALKAHGSQGAYVRLPAKEKNVIDFYVKLGFYNIQLPIDESNDNFVFLGRAI